MNRFVVEEVLPVSGLEYRVIDMDFSRTLEEMVGGAMKKSLRALALLYRLVAQLRGFRPDLVYLTFGPTGGALLRDLIIVWICRLFGKRVCLHLHGTGLAKRNSRYYRWAYRSLLGEGWLILLAESLYPDVAAFIPRERCLVLPNAVSGPEATQGRVCTGRVKRILYLANYQPAKGLLTAIDIFAVLAPDFPELELHLVGAYSKRWSEPQMRDYLGRLPPAVGARVHVHGPLFGAAKQQALARADLFLYPSRHDAFPLVLLEALAHGLPLVSTAQGAIPDILRNGWNGLLIDPERVGDAAREIARLIGDPARVRTLSRNARTSFLQQYRLETYRRNWTETIRRVAV